MSASTMSARAPRRQVVLLAVLAAVLGFAVLYVLLPAVTGGSAAPVAAQGAAATAPAVARGRGPAGPREVVEVHLDRLRGAAVTPEGTGRNPFRMGGGQGSGAAAGPSPAVPMTPVLPPVPAGPPPPPPVPPIPYRFIGVVTAAGQPGKIAVLSDGKTVQSGREGALIDGRYRIVRIGEESIQMEHQDGRGRQTIRLTGQ